MSKRTLTLMCFILVLGLAANASAGLVGHWKLDDGAGTTAVDATGNGHDGTLIGNPQWVVGYLGGGLQFSGSTDKVDIPQSAELNPENEFTASVWANLDPAGSGYRSPITSRDGGPARGYIIYCTPANTWQFWTGPGWDSVGSPAVVLGEWTHVVATYSNGEKKLYINGGLAAEGTATMSPNTAQVLRIGAGATEGAGAYFFHGTIDDVRVYDRALSADQVGGLHSGIDPTFPKAESPDPADGAMIMATWAILGWSPGQFATSHDLYMGDNFDDVNDGIADTFLGNHSTETVYVGFFGVPFPDGLVPGTTYYWRVDEVDPANIYKGDVWSFSIPPTTAWAPAPADGAGFVDPDVALNWAAGLDAILHYVHFGDNFDDVNNAAVGTGTPAAATTFTPGTLELDKTYYWRVDESTPPAAPIKGDVWSFTTLPDMPITDPNLIGWWTLDEGMGVVVLDWSGHGNGGTLANGPQWVAGNYGAALQFDGTEDYVDLGTPSELYIPDNYTYTAWFKVGQDINGDGGAQYLLCIGSRSDLVFGVEDGVGTDGDLALHYYDTAPGFHAVGVGQTVWSADEWHMVAGTKDSTGHKIYLNGEFRNSDFNTNDDNLNTGRIVSIGAMGWNTDEYFNGTIDDVRIYNKTLTQDEIKQVMRGDVLLAWNPSPVNNSTTDVVRTTSVSWSAGDNAAQHDVYFGTDKDAVDAADASDTTGVFRGLQAGTSYTPPEGVAWAGGPYYWRIDEHSTDGTVTKGNTWKFSVADYILVEDFESYNDIEAGEPGSNLVYETWLDGYGTTTNGSAMGYTVAFQPTMETDNPHSGRQSAPLEYNNTTAAFSEATRTLAAQNWTEHGVKTLGLWFHGAAGNTGQLYVKVNGSKVVYDGDPADMRRGWQAWNIDLASVGANLQSVTSLAIGVEGFSATGTVLLDDIRLYALSREFITPVQPDPAGLLGHWTFDGNTLDSSGLGNDGTANGGPTYTVGKVGQAMSFDGTDDYVVIDGVADDITSNDITLAAWVNMTSDADWYPVISCNTAGGGNVGWLSVDDGYADFGSLTGTMYVTDNTWHHLAYTRVGDIGSLYVDGVLEGTHTPSFNFSTSNLWSIGQEWDGGPSTSDFFVGTVDDARIYNYGLSYAEIAGLAGRTLPFDKPF